MFAGNIIGLPGVKMKYFTRIILMISKNLPGKRKEGLYPLEFDGNSGFLEDMAEDVEGWCERGDLNPYGFLHWILSAKTLVSLTS